MVATVSGAQCIARFSKLKSWSDKMKLIQPYINKAQKFTQYANAATAIASSILNIHDKITHEEEEILADITLIVSSVLSILSDPINRAIIKGGLEGQDLATAKFSDLSSISRIFLQLFCLARYATSVISVFTIIITMLKKDECTGSDYFNLASSLFTCYGTVTSPRTAKKIFEQVQNECKFEEFNETKRQIEASKNANKSDGVAETAVIVGAAAAVGAGATAKISDVNQSDPKGPNEINYCINKNSASNDCAVSTAVGGGIGSGSGSGNPNDPQKPPSGGDHQNEATKTYKNYETSNKAGLRGDPPATDAEKTELIKKRDELAKNIIKDENDEAGKAAKEYYEKNILLVFKGSENEHVMNQQLVRMMEAATDIREMFCEIALTETTFDIKNGVLLINGQLNIDGAAFAVATNNLNDGQKKSDIGQRLLDKIAAEAAGQKYIDPKNALKSDREKIMAETKNYDENKEIIAAKFEEDKSKLTEKRNTEREELIEKQKAARDGFLNSKKKNEMTKKR
uniref:DUF4781 domain-containing protein n=1 Tax=Panagrolaimus superbus TaxID=310955 RepID=A0A914YRL0_9BILA